MRPDILNPLFAEVEALKGVGPQVAKAAEAARPRPGRSTCSIICRPGRSSGSVRPPPAPRCSAGIVILDVTPFEIREPDRAAAPFRIFASRLATATRITLIYFNNPGWAKKQLPLGEKRTVSGKLEAYGDEWQIIHPEVLRAGQGGRAGAARAGLSADRGLTNRRMRRAGAARRWSARPSCPNGSSRA